MILRYAIKLGLKICFTNVNIWKINGTTLETFRIVLTSFPVEDKLNRAQIFLKHIVISQYQLGTSARDIFFDF